MKFRKYFTRLDYFELLKVFKKLIVKKIVCFKDEKWLARKLIKTFTRNSTTFKTFVCWSRQLIMGSLRKTTVSSWRMLLSEFVRF